MPNQVQKIASSFTREVDQNIGFLNANLGSTNDKVEDDWKKKIKDLRWSEIFWKLDSFVKWIFAKNDFQMEKKENFGYSEKKYGRREMLEM